MPSIRSLLVATLLSAVYGCGTSEVNAPTGNSAENSEATTITNSLWGSDAANLAVRSDSATLRLLAPGGCVGSYVDAANPVGSLSISLAGIYTQLIGAYPGKLTYPAQITGSVRGNTMQLTVNVPALALVIGPLSLTRGVSHNWPDCLYP